MDKAEITGKVTVGSRVEFEGYYGRDGKFEVTRVQTVSSSKRQDKGGGSGDQQNPGGNGGDGDGGGGDTEGGGDP